MAERRVAITRRVSLADFADGWDDCFAIVTLASYDDVVKIDGLDLKSMTQTEIVAFEIEVVKKHFVSGKIRVLNSDGSTELVDMTPADIKASIPMADQLYATIMGIRAIPKDTPQEVPSKSVPSNDSNTSKTSSSTD